MKIFTQIRLLFEVYKWYKAYTVLLRGVIAVIIIEIGWLRLNFCKDVVKHFVNVVELFTECFNHIKVIIVEGMA